MRHVGELFKIVIVVTSGKDGGGGEALVNCGVRSGTRCMSVCSVCCIELKTKKKFKFHCIVVVKKKTGG
jgi:hypothetical protein